MNTLQVARSSREAEASADPSWRGLYRAGGVSAILAGVILIVAVLLDFSMQPAPIADGAATLQYIASHRSLYILEQVLWLVPSVLAMVVFLALPMSLKHLNKSYAAIGALIGIASWALTLAWPTTGGGGHALVYLSDQYMAATTAAAEGFIAQNTIPTITGVLEPVGILIVSLLMLKGVFHKGVAYFGIITGALGIMSEALRPILNIGYAVYGILLILWFLVIGWNLYRLAASSSHSRVAKKLEARAVQ